MHPTYRCPETCFTMTSRTTTRRFAIVLLAAAVGSPTHVLAQCGCTTAAPVAAPTTTQTYRLDYRTVYDEQQVTAYRVEYETVYDEKTITVQKPVWETETR